MKTIATMLFGAVTVVGACFIGAAAATYVLAMPEGQHFANLDAPDLWTSVPKPVDPEGPEIRAGRAPCLGSLSHYTDSARAQGEPCGQFRVRWRIVRCRRGVATA